MPNFDRGHYFLTALAPVKTHDPAYDRDMGRPHVQVLRDVLACLPTPLAGAKFEAFGITSPFARCSRTHRARFVVIDDVAYRGGEPQDPVCTALPEAERTEPGEADHLNAPFLLFAADFDAESGDDAALESWLAELWRTMEAELVAVLQHCVGFDGVRSAEAFAAYIKRCQVETTLAVNDYGAAPTPAEDMPVPRRLTSGLATLLGMLRSGNRPLPAAPDTDLPSIRRALDLQRAFAAFAAAARDSDARTLYRDFGAFIATHEPGGPEDRPREGGTIGS